MNFAKLKTVKYGIDLHVLVDMTTNEYWTSFHPEWPDYKIKELLNKKSIEKLSNNAVLDYSSF